MNLNKPPLPQSFLPTTSRKYNMVRGAAALYLLGKIAYAPALDDILSIISGWQAISPDSFVPDEFIGDLEEYRFQYLTQAITAALKIAAKHPTLRAKALSGIHAAIDPDTFSIHSTLKGGNCVKFEMAPLIRSAVQKMEANIA